MEYLFLMKNTLQIYKARNDILSLNRQYHEKYGSTYVLHSVIGTTVTSNDPEDIKYVTTTNFDNFVRVEESTRKTRIYEKFERFFGNGIFVSDGEVWKHQRYIATPLFNIMSIDNMVPIFFKHANNLYKHFNESSHSQKSVNIQDLFKRLTLDAFSEIGFGVEINSLEQKTPFAEAFDFAQERIVVYYRAPYLMYTKDSQFDLSINNIDKFIYNIIEARKGSSIEVLEKNNDLLSRFMCLRDDEGNPYNPQFLRDIVLNFFIAGRDTTGQLLTWTFYLLSKYPNVYKKLLEEVENFNEEISTKNVKEMHYLNNVIHETLRLYPSVPALIRTAVKDDILPGGVPILKGERFIVNVYSLHRNKKYWDNPDDFIPERWDKSPIKHQNQFFPFYGGPMKCLGKQLALLEAKTLIVSILKNYTFELDNSIDVFPIKSIILVSKEGVHMTFKKRDNK